MSDKRKRIWKRVRFWGGVLLVVVVGIGILAYVTHRKSLGPPPTPPGRSPEFDQHLAEIDDDWLFLFEEDGRLVLADIYGKDVASLLDVRDDGRRIAVSDACGSSHSRFAAVAYQIETHEGRAVSRLELAFIDMMRHSVKKVPLDGMAFGFFPGPPYCLDENTALFRFHGFGDPSGGSPTPLGTTRYFRIGAEGPTFAEPGELQLTLGEHGKEPSLVFDEESRLLMLRKPMADGNHDELLVYDVHGLRPATAKEEKRYRELSKVEQNTEIPAIRPRPSIDVSDRERNDWERKILERYFGISGRFRELSVDGSLIRKAESRRGAEDGIAAASWDRETGLVWWYEGDFPSVLHTYFSDTEGHYRLWHEGMYCGKIPRWKVNDQDGGEARE